ncbi:type II secretion system secretin GspD [Leucothrix pacifica]|uniref:Type II secretion system protein GspD n=1 Tax=Leucothrix pacifica TaxID=1247513 RepID=A0A317CJ65_9GAMM|nr:type II secretion system secretin GspD [Leucothrix pacifica]PWQ98598.1 type II secretion system protein GspD [Leucothrix pacifica]
MISEFKTYKSGLKVITLSAAFFLGSATTCFAAGYNLNLRDADLQALVTTISAATGKNFVLDKQVRGQKVTIITGSEIDEDKLYATFLSVLQMHGLSAIDSDGIIKIIPANKGKYQSVPVIKDPTGIPEIDRKTKKKEPDALYTKVIKASHVPVANMVPILRPMISPTGHLQGYPPSNSIVVTDTAANISKVTDLVRNMDRPDEDEMEVVTLRFASAVELVKTIQGLQGAATQKGAVAKYKVSPDVRTNSVLVSGSKSGRSQVKDIIRRLDRPKIKTEEESTRVVYLRYAKAEDLAKVLQSTTANAVSAKASAEGGAGTQKAKVTISADASTNTLVITAEPEVHRNILEVVKRLDIRRAQVMVEAVIAEVSMDLSKELGMQIGAYDATGGSPLVSTSFSGSSFSLANIVSGALPTGTGMLLGIGGGSEGNTQWGAVMNALASDAATNILSTPTIVTMDNVEANMVVGQNVPFVTGTTTNDTNTNPFQTIERQDIGITLKVTPQINSGRSIMLKLEQEVSSLAASSASASDLITNKRSFSTQVMVEDGQMLVIGGLIEDTFRDTEQKVPILGDLPFIGKAFRNTVTEKSKQNLMVFIHPMIMRDVLTADSFTMQKYNDLRGAQMQSRVNQRGSGSRMAAEFPNDPNVLLTENPSIIRQEQLQRHIQVNQQQANTQTHRYDTNAPARPSRPLTVQQRQQIAKQREAQQKHQNEMKRRQARQAEQARREEIQRRRNQVLQRDRELKLLHQQKLNGQNGNRGTY